MTRALNRDWPRDAHTPRRITVGYSFNTARITYPRKRGKTRGPKAARLRSGTAAAEISAFQRHNRPRGAAAALGAARGAQG